MTQQNTATIIIYTHPDCSYSAAAKDNFQKSGVEFREIDVTLHPEAVPELGAPYGGRAHHPRCSGRGHGYGGLLRRRLKLLTRGAVRPLDRASFVDRDTGRDLKSGCKVSPPFFVSSDPWCSGLTYRPVKPKIAGSNPVGSASV